MARGDSFEVLVYSAVEGFLRLCGKFAHEMRNEFRGSRLCGSGMETEWARRRGPSKALDSSAGPGTFVS